MKLCTFLIVLVLGHFNECSLLSEETKSSVSLANNEFALDLLKKLHIAGENVFFSPFSISAAVAMTSLGAGGTTLDEINSAFHFNDVLQTSTDSKALHQTYKEIITDYKGRSQNLDLANRLFSKNDLNLLAQFLTDVENYYNATVEKVDFSSGDGERIINQWVSQQTNYKINQLFTDGTIDPNALFVLVNAIYFKEDWKYQFYSSMSLGSIFHINTNETMWVRMMIQTKQYHYIKDEELDAQVLEMPYKEGNISMIIILPQLGELPNLISNLTAQKFNEILEAMTETQVRVRFPRLTTESKYSLGDTLGQLGIHELFTNSANLSGIVDVPSKISKIVHKALLKINEQGTEAAAATGIEGFPVSLPYYPPVDYPEFIVDHPFLLFIVDRSHKNIILFAGALSRAEYND